MIHAILGTIRNLMGFGQVSRVGMTECPKRLTSSDWYFF